MMKRLFGLLTVAMLISWLAACGGAQPEPKAKTSPTTSQATEAPKATEAATTAPLPATEVLTETTKPLTGTTTLTTTLEVTATTTISETAKPSGDTPKKGEKPTDKLGVVEVKPGQPIVIGYGLVTSGPNSNLGIDSIRGIEIALDDIDGKVFGHEIQLTGEDTGCSPEGGQTAGNKLISNKQIVAIIGTTCSSEAKVMAPVIHDAGMVMISPSNTAPDLTDPAKHVQGYLRTAHNDKVQGRIAAEFAYNELKVKKAATIHDGSLYAEQLANVFAENFENLGGEMVAQEAVNDTDTDMSPVLTRIASLQPDVIYYPIFMPAGGFITRQAKDVKGLENTVLMSADGLFNPDFVKAAGKASIGMYLSSPDLTSLGSTYQEFLKKHKAKYNEDTLSVYHANAYDATNMIVNAIKEVAVEGPDGTLYIPRQAMRDVLYKTKDYKGLTGNLTCDANGDCADPKIVVYEIQNADEKAWNPGSSKTSNPMRVYPKVEASKPISETGETMPESSETRTEEINTQGGFAVVPPVGWQASSSGDQQMGITTLTPEKLGASEAAMIVLSSGPRTEIPITGTQELTADSMLDVLSKQEDAPKVSETRKDIVVGGIKGRSATFEMTEGTNTIEGTIVAVVIDSERAFTMMGTIEKGKWDQEVFDKVIASVRFFQPGTEKPTSTKTLTDTQGVDDDNVAHDTDDMMATKTMTDTETMTNTEILEPEAVTAPPSDPLGVVEVKSGQPIVIGYGLVTSGPNSNLGIDSMRGIDIALADVGGKIFGHEIQLTGEDTGCSPEGGQTAGNKLISNKQIVAIVGTTCSSEAKVMAPVIDEAGMVMISPSNTAPDLTDPAKHVQGYLRTAHNDKVQGKIAAEFAYNELQLKNAATIHDGSVYAEQLANVFAENFKTLGGEVVAQEAVNDTDTDMTPVLTRIASLKPDVIYYPIFMPAGGFITRQAKEVKGLESVALMSADGLFNPDFVKAAGQASIGMYLSSPDLTSLGSAYQEFLKKHKAKYNEDTLSVYHANAYDAAMLIINAIKKTAKQGPDGTLYIPRQAMRDVLYKTKNYKGLTGNLTCDANGDCADPKIVVYKIQNADEKAWNPGSTSQSNPQKVYP